MKEQVAVRPGRVASTKPSSDILQRAAVRRTSDNSVPPVVREVLRSPGQALDPGTRAFMEPRFGYDFSRVRVHADARAAESARAVDALAYTVGPHVVFGRRQYAPQTGEGQRLLAHELAHVVQQQSLPETSSSRLAVGEPASETEQEAAQAANQALGPSLERPSIGAATLPGHVAGGSMVQRQAVTTVPGQSLWSSPAPLVQMPSEMIDLAPGEAISAGNPKLVQLATSFKALLPDNPQAYIDLSAYLTQSAEMSSEKASQERQHLQERMVAARGVLQGLGVPQDKVHIEPAYAFATRLGGQISATLYKEPRPLLLPSGPGPLQSVLGTKPPAKPTTPLPSLSELLTFKFKAGPVQFTVDLPKSATAKLPVAISNAKSLSFELEAETSGSFSFSVTLDDKPNLRVSLKAGLSLDKEKGTSGSVGLAIESLHTVCHADNPELLKAKITSAGEKLKKAGQEYGAAKTSEDKLSKAVDMAGAIGDMYDAVDKSKKGCKQVTAAKLEFGLQGPLAPTPGSLAEPDPSKRPATSVGVTLTVPF
jgi:hypothetical protein